MKAKQQEKSQSQSDKFKAMAKEVEADAPEGLFDQMLKKMAAQGKKKPAKK